MQKVIESSFEMGNIDFRRDNGKGTQWFVLKLDCGHIVGRYTRPLNDIPPKEVHCEFCLKDDTRIASNIDYTSDRVGWERHTFKGTPRI